MTNNIDDILNYMQKAGLNTIAIGSPAWNLVHNVEKFEKIDKKALTRQKFDNSIGFEKKILDISIGYENGQKMTVGQLVRHRTVPQLGLGVVVGESKMHKGFWIVQWCDIRYHDVGQLGIDKEYLEIV